MSSETRRSLTPASGLSIKINLKKTYFLSPCSVSLYISGRMFQCLVIHLDERLSFLQQMKHSGWSFFGHHLRAAVGVISDWVSANSLFILSNRLSFSCSIFQDDTTRLILLWSHFETSSFHLTPLIRIITLSTPGWLLVEPLRGQIMVTPTYSCLKIYLNSFVLRLACP